jgi:mannose-6-phosphate isomerase-like protein (cupin superfamily)
MEERMKRIPTMIGVVVILAVATMLNMLAAQTNRTAPAIYITATDIQALLKQVPPDSVTDQAIRTISAGNLNVGVGVVHRSAKAMQNAITHDELTEIYHILSGSGTLVTGGSVVKPERYPADSPTVKDLAGPSWRGTALENGVSRKVKAGDVVIIPTGSGHWFSQIDGVIDYEVMRVDPGKLLSLK